MITCNNLSLAMNETPILKNIDLTVNKGECVVITGPSGSGKSTFINLLAGLIPELYDGSLSTGEIQVEDKPLPPKDFYDYVKTLGIVFQNPKTQFFTSDVYSELAFPMENYGVPQQEMLERLNQKVASLQLEPFIDRNMLALSGGEKQLVAFASSSMMSHQLFLLDEPSSNLDTLTQQKLLTALTNMKEAGMTIVIAEHRLDYLLPLADRFVIMTDGQIEQELTTPELFNLSDQTLHEMGLRAVHSETTKQLSPNQLAKNKETSCLSLENINYRYHKKATTSLEIPQLNLNNQEIIGVVGHNGAGKSTFSKLLTGLVKPKSGNIYLNGKKLTKKELIKKSFLVMQDVNLQLFFETVEKELTLTPVDGQLFDTVVEKLNLSHLLTRHPQTLSGGEKQRVAIASALLSGKELIIFDEPTSGLDYRHMKKFSETLTWLKDSGVFVLVISHDQEFIQTACDRLITFKNGKIT